MAIRNENSFTEIEVTWQAPTGPTPEGGYRVDYMRVGDSNTEMRTVSVGTTSYTITGEWGKSVCCPLCQCSCLLVPPHGMDLVVLTNLH